MFIRPWRRIWTCSIFTLLFTYIDRSDWSTTLTLSCSLTCSEVTGVLSSSSVVVHLHVLKCLQHYPYHQLLFTYMYWSVCSTTLTLSCCSLICTEVSGVLPSPSVVVHLHVLKWLEYYPHPQLFIYMYWGVCSTALTLSCSFTCTEVSAVLPSPSVSACFLVNRPLLFFFINGGH
jgi:hypothetical protein